VLVIGTEDADFSGSVVTADKPIQIITGVSCTQMPDGTPACDHVEETLLPGETLGKHYFVSQPTGTDGNAGGHVVRFFGNVDATELTYPGSNPGGPTTLQAGEMVEIGPVFDDFEVVADQALIIATFQLGQGPVSGPRKGDPSQSFAVTVEQYRTSYIFLAPDDYDVSFADVVQPMDATLLLDGTPVTQTPTLISSGHGATRIPISGGAHRLESTQPFGLQIVGYGEYTSYQYPGGLNLGMIAPPPDPK
jgi:hypothetical protein